MSERPLLLSLAVAVAVVPLAVALAVGLAASACAFFLASLARRLRSASLLPSPRAPRSWRALSVGDLRSPSQELESLVVSVRGWGLRELCQAVSRPSGIYKVQSFYKVPASFLSDSFKLSVTYRTSKLYQDLQAGNPPCLCWGVLCSDPTGRAQVPPQVGRVWL